MAISFCLGCYRDRDGYYWITGRADDMLNVSGHLLSTAQVESAIVEHKAVAEAAAVSSPHPIKGECIYCFVVLKNGYTFSLEMEKDIKDRGNNWIGLRTGRAVDALTVTFAVCRTSANYGAVQSFDLSLAFTCPSLPLARDKIGALAAPEVIHPISALPKTRSGKIMRRILAKVTRNDTDLGDISTMADESILEELYTSRHQYAAF